MNYASATIDVTNTERGDTTTIDLEGIKTLGDLIAAVWDELDPEGENHTDEIPEGVTFTNPQGFAVHLFNKMERGVNTPFVVPCDNFDDIAQAWSDETDEDRREAMGEYLDDSGADDLSDFDEAYQGKFDSGADFAEQTAEALGEILSSWIVIDWEASWERGLRYDYTMTDHGHVFRDL